MIEEGAVVVANGRITAVGAVSSISQPAAAQVIEAPGCILTPGFIDLQCNGAFGLDFTQNPEAIWAAAAQLPCYGVTSFLPTIITSPPATVQKAQQVMGQRPSAFSGAEPLGLHLEGPFLNPRKKGAHNPAHLQLPHLETVAEWSPENYTRLVTLAPELPGALALIAALARRGVVVGVGHSLASFVEARAGFDAGALYGTHLYNAMPTLHHRQPGLIGALLADGRMTIGLIADGVHVHPLLVKLAWQAAAGRLNIVTDAMAALGMPPGVYNLGDHRVTVDETGARLPDGTLAGCVVSLDTAVRNLIAYTGCTLPEAVGAVTTTPANLLGLGQRKGRIAPGCDADLVLLTPELQPAMTLVSGQIVYDTLEIQRNHVSSR